MAISQSATYDLNAKFQTTLNNNLTPSPPTKKKKKKKKRARNTEAKLNNNARV